MRLIEPLPFEIKLELVSKIFDSLKTNFNKPEAGREALLNELFGSWNDVDDSIVEDILNRRTISKREIRD